MEMAKLIKQQRKLKGLTQKQLGEFVHVSEQAVSKWERGISTPDLSLLEPLSSILDISISELVTGKREVNQQTVLDMIDYSKKEIKESKKRFLKNGLLMILSICIVLPLINDLFVGEGFSYRCLFAHSCLNQAARNIVDYDCSLENYIYDSEGMTSKLMTLKENGVVICDYIIDWSRIRLDDMFLFLEMELIVEYENLTYLLLCTGTYQNGKISFMHIYPKSSWSIEVPLWMNELNDVLCTYNPG